MELDRDRRAVVQKHDIENKVADVSSREEGEKKGGKRRKEKARAREFIESIYLLFLICCEIWTKSIVVRQDLVPIFFDLLMMNDEVTLPSFSSLIISPL